MNNAQKKTILVVDDEPMLLQSLVDAFTAKGFNVLGAANGQEGLEVATQRHPDIILLDIVMPKMDGIAMLKALRDDAWGKAVPVIILTNLSDYTNVADALQHGVNDFLVKSNWEIEDVVQKVRQKLKMDE